MAKTLSWLLRHPFIRFTAVGAAGYVVNAVALAIFTGHFGLGVDAGLALAIFTAMGFTWIGNRYLTFAARRAHGARAIIEEWLRFAGANSLGAVINYLAALGLVHFGPGLLANKFVAQAIGVLAGLVFNFTLSRLLVFRGTDDPAGSAAPPTNRQR